MNLQATATATATIAEKGPTPDASPAEAGLRLADVPRAEAACLVAVVAALAYAYAPDLRLLYDTWVREPDYTHGFLVLPIALFILWRRWPGAEAPPTPWWPAWVLVAASLAARSWFLERGSTWLESATMLPVIVGLGLARFGPRAMLRVWPAFAFLIFLYPLPTQLNAALAQPLQNFATICACFLLRLTGLWVMPEGNVIMIGNERLEVATACNGLSMLMSLAATVSAAASVVPMANWKRVVLLPSIIPIALGSNVLRITATAWCCYKFGSLNGMKYAHDAAGWLMMPTAMVLVALELTLLSWLVVESDAGQANKFNLVSMSPELGPTSIKQGARP